MDRLRELAASGELAGIVLAALPGTGLLVFDTSLRLVFAGGEALTRDGLEAPRLIGRTIAETLPAQLHDAMLPRYRAALAGEDQHFTYSAFDGSRDYLVDISPLRRGAHVIGGVVFSRDVTELTRRGA